MVGQGDSEKGPLRLEPFSLYYVVVWSTTFSGPSFQGCWKNTLTQNKQFTVVSKGQINAPYNLYLLLVKHLKES